MRGGAENIMIFDTKSRKYYHPAPMSDQARIDALQFARDGRRLEGEIPVAAMQRLHDVVTESSGVVRYCIEGSLDAQRKPVLDVAVEARLPLVCQRCLEPTQFDLRRRSRFVVSESARDLPDVAAEDPETETLPADVLADVADVIEQEVLLGVPLAPMHAPGACSAAPESEAVERVSPFAVLERLKRTP
jgi:uncharacterized protein